MQYNDNMNMYWYVEFVEWNDILTYRMVRFQNDVTLSGTVSSWSSEDVDIGCTPFQIWYGIDSSISLSLEKGQGWPSPSFFFPDVGLGATLPPLALEKGWDDQNKRFLVGSPTSLTTTTPHTPPPPPYSEYVFLVHIIISINNYIIT